MGGLAREKENVKIGFYRRDVGTKAAHRTQPQLFSSIFHDMLFKIQLVSKPHVLEDSAFTKLQSNCP